MEKVLITGAAGFLGSHLCDRFIKEGYYVIGMDNLITGDMKNFPVMACENGFHKPRSYLIIKIICDIGDSNSAIWPRCRGRKSSWL